MDVVFQALFSNISLITNFLLLLYYLKWHFSLQMKSIAFCSIPSVEIRQHLLDVLVHLNVYF